MRYRNALPGWLLIAAVLGSLAASQDKPITAQTGNAELIETSAGTNLAMTEADYLTLAKLFPDKRLF